MKVAAIFNTVRFAAHSQPLVSALVLAAALLHAGTAGAGAENAQTAFKLPRPEIPEKTELAGSYVAVHGAQMYYLEQGSGDPVVFIHGNPTSSYLWRNVIPHVSAQARAIAPDLIGMGRSDKPDIEYRYRDHYRYLEGFLDALSLTGITFVVHDWGATLGFDYASRNPGRVKAIAFMEGVLPPTFPQPSFEAMGEELGGMFRAIKDPVKGHELIIDNHMFVEQILPGFVNRSLGSAAMEIYRQPYILPAHRKPLLAWPREIPIAGEPQDVIERMEAINAFMMETELPLLLLYADPGVVMPPALIPWYVGNVKNLETVFVGQGLHFIQEDQPDAIGRAVADWLRRLEARS